MAKRKKKTPLQQEYAKQRKRIKQFIKRAEKRGYYFEDGVIPQVPKIITEASVRRLKKLTPNVLYSKAEYASEETYGEIISGAQGRKIEKARQKQLKSKNVSRETFLHYPMRVNTDLDFWDRTILDDFRFNLDSLKNGEAYPLLKAWFNALIRENGATNVAKMLQDAGEQGYFITRDIGYKTDKARAFMNSVLDFLPDQGVMYKDSIMDRLTYSRELEQAVENDEGWEEY